MALLDFLSKDKRIIRCYRCNAPTTAGEAKAINGTNYCPTCYQRIQAAQNRQKSGQSGQTAPKEPRERSFADKYGKGGGSSKPVTPEKPIKPATPEKPAKPVRPVTPTGNAGGCPAQLLDIKRVMDETKTKYREIHNGRQWEIEAGFSGEKAKYHLKFICTEGDDSVALRIFGLVSAEPSQYRKLYPLLNELQDTYRYLRFTLDGDGDVNVEYDIPNCSKDAGLVALEMIVRIGKILDEVYPRLKRAAYS